MIPILYSETETEFTSNGLGGLSEMSECTVTEERNGKYELTAVYPVTGIHFKDLRCGRYIKAVPSEGKDAQPFEIVELTPSTSNTVQITAQHISYRLSRIPVKTRTTPVTSAAAALTALKSDALEDCPFTFWTDVTTQASYTTPTPASLRSRLGGSEGSVLDVYGGEYDWDKFDVKLYANRGEDTGALLAYGKNITSLEQETSIANTVTGIYPYWQGTKDDGSTVTVEADAPVYCDNAANFPYRSSLAVDFSSDFQTQPTKAQLVERAKKYIIANHVGTPSVNLKVRFAALWQTEEYKELAAVERVRLCDTVTVRFDRLGVSAKAKVIATEYDVLKDRYNSIELGDAKSDFADTLAEHTGNSIAKSERRQRGFLDEAIAEATQKISGGRGGYVVLSRASDGTPDEILIMDTPDKATAVNVIRMNKSGIGFSTSGYDGPFRSAWTIDGKFNADFITTGTLLADLIKAGTLSDVAGNTSWDMASGVLTAKKFVLNAGNGQISEDGTVAFKVGQIGDWMIGNSSNGWGGALYSKSPNGCTTYIRQPYGWFPRMRG
jgi:phage minor structural protein